jgi:hypothetical protein
MADILTTIEIDAPPERVWQVLSETTAYDEWNPFITRVRGALSPGGRLDFMVPLGRRDFPIDATILTVEENKEIRWRGPRSAVLGKVFSGEHYFQLEPLPNGRTRFIHGETFRGVVPDLLWSRLEPWLLPLYNSMNEAMKRRAEKR